MFQYGTEAIASVCRGAPLVRAPTVSPAMRAPTTTTTASHMAPAYLRGRRVPAGRFVVSPPRGLAVLVPIWSVPLSVRGRRRRGSCELIADDSVNDLVQAALGAEANQVA